MKTLPVALVATVLLALAYGMSPARSQFTSPYPACHWPPRPQDIVTIDGKAVINVGQRTTLFTVPVDRWFVVTQIEVRQPGVRTGAEEILVVEVLGSTETRKWHARNISERSLHDGSDGVGLAFRPGSQLAHK